MSRLLRINTAFEECKRHIEENKLSGTRIESFLTQYLLVLLSADVQEEISKISIGAIKHSTECNYLEKYVTNSVEKTFRSVGVDKLSGLLANFGEELKQEFNSRLDEKDVSFYSNAIRARHEVAHKAGTSISFGDLEKGINCAAKIIDAYEGSMQNINKIKPIEI